MVLDGCEGSGDGNFDCYEDNSDYALFQACKTGPGPYPDLGIACIYFDMDGDSDVDLRDFQEFKNRFHHEPSVCTDPQPTTCSPDAYITLNVSTDGTSGATASIFPNPVWMNELELSPTGSALSYANAPRVTLSLLDGDVPSFFYWEVDGVPQTTGQQTVTVTMDETHSVQAVFAPPGEIVWDSDHLSPDHTSRSLRFRVDAAVTASGSPGQDAIQITMLDLQNPFPANLPQYPPPQFHCWEAGAACGTVVGTCNGTGEANGCARWVGKPGTFLEAQDIPLGASYRAARLQCTPFYYDWITETASGPIALVGAEIVPSSVYNVQTYGASCKGDEANCTNVSTVVTMFTRRSGDVSALFNPPELSDQPDAIDIVQLVNKLKNVVGAPSKAIAQLQPNLPELNADVSALDIVAVVDAVKQFAYSFSGPCPCPSAVTCGPGAGSTPCRSPGDCVTAFGAGALCVKTCGGGSNDAKPCINDTHCTDEAACGHMRCFPDLTCSLVGFCRDRCGRCTP